jgi:hypothetical protein
VGNRAVEDLFVLAALAGPKSTRVIISPTDFRDREVTLDAGSPDWTRQLYSMLKDELVTMPRRAGAAPPG